MVKHQCCTLACQVHLDCGTAPLPCMVQRAPSAVHLCCTYGTRRTIPIKLKYGTCARCGAPVVCSPLHCTPAAAEIHAETHWSERHLNLNERTMSCAKRYLRKRRKVILTLMPFTHRACFLCHTWSHYSHTWRSCTAGGEKKKKKVEVPTPCVTSSPVFLLGTRLTHVLAWSIRTNLELLAFKRSLWSQVVVTCSVLEVGNDDDYNSKADNI